jgi:murein DD-endopeptidase MepM/ murein hydrolase activator NlpD
MSYPSVVTGEHGPASDELITWLKSIFGKAFSVSRGYSTAHDGIDLPAKAGTPIKAIASGTVTYARDARVEKDRGVSGWAKHGGNVVNIDIGSQLTTQYAHLARFIVREGQYVKQGDVIGYVGSTGGSPDSPTANFGASSAHLHFGLWDRKVNRMINPQSFLENWDTSNLGAWGDQISFPVGHVLTAEDIDSIMQTLKENGWFTGDSILGGSETKTREILTSHIGDIWSTNFEQTLQQEFMDAAEAAVDPITALANIGPQIADTFTWIGFILIGVVLIAGGIFLLKPNTVIKETA